MNAAFEKLQQVYCFLGGQPSKFLLECEIPDLSFLNIPFPSILKQYSRNLVHVCNGNHP